MGQSTPPILIPIQPELFWEQVRLIIREEIKVIEKKVNSSGHGEFETPGLKYKPLYKMCEVCTLLQVSRPTIYEWIKLDKLKPYKIRSRVYFLWDDVQKLLQPKV